MTVRRILVLESQTPFVHGGAEILVRELTSALQTHGYETEIVSVPFRDTPHDELMAHAAAWRLLDLSHAAHRPVDLVIPTKFPTYFVRHPLKVTWLVHQHRAAYELCGTAFSDFDHTEADVGLRKRLIALDTEMLRECAGVFTIARTVSERLRKYNGIAAEPLYSPPKLASRLRRGPYGEYFVTVTRLEHVKRVDLAIEAFRHVAPPARLLIAGEGGARADLERRIVGLGLEHRVSILGRVTDDELIGLYSGARGLLFTPYEEDYGYVTLEAFLSRKPVITTSDAGGPLEFVANGVNGLVVAPEPGAVAEAVNRIAADEAFAARLGDAGFDRARSITWASVAEQLVAAAERSAGAVTAN